MVLLIALSALLIWAIVSSAVELRRDGYRRVPTDWSRVAGRDPHQQAASGHAYR